MATAQTATAPKKKVVQMIPGKTGAAKPATKTIAKPAAKAAATNGEAEAAPSRFKGVTSNMRVQEYQNHTLAQNIKAKLTDEQLAELWRTEFPNAKEFTAGIVNSVRNSYNRGAHKNEKPANPIPQFLEDGTKVFATRGRRPGATAQAEETAPVAKAAKKTAKQ